MTSELDPQSAAEEAPRIDWRKHWHKLLLLVILGVGAYLRFSGLNWDDGTHLHPDERFLTLVEVSLQPVEGLGAYFDTATSTLNPNNVGHSFYVYGTLPIFIVRYLADWIGQTGYGEVHLVGRAASASFDLISIFLVYLLGTRLYRRRVGLLAAAFSAVSVLLIQHAHFFVVDPFANAFILAGLFFAVVIMDEGGWENYALFGLFLGMSVASKISAAPLAGMVALAAGVRAFKSEDRAELRQAVLGVSLAAFVSFLAFRVFQPYAFQGTSFFDIRLNPKWLSTMAEVRRQVSGQVDFPPALQWVDRMPVLFSFKNIVLWGLGLPLGITAWASWGWAVWRSIQGKGWDRHLIPVVWTGAYFVWRSIGFTQAMRYHLPIYPTLAILAAWGLWALYDRADSFTKSPRWARAGAATLGGLVLAGTTLYAFGFLKIYTTPLTRVEASRWIYSHVPSAVNVVIDTPSGEKMEPLAVPDGFTLQPGQPTMLNFTSRHTGRATSIMMPAASRTARGVVPDRLTFELYEGAPSDEPLAEATFEGRIPPNEPTRLEAQLRPEVEIRDGASYTLQLALDGEPILRGQGDPALILDTETGQVLNDVPLPDEQISLASGEQQVIPLETPASGRALGVRFPRLTLAESANRPLTFRAVLRPGGQETELASGSVSLSDPAALASEPLDIAFNGAVTLQQGQRYDLVLSLSSAGGVAFTGSTVVVEASWDDALPTRIDGYDIGGRFDSRNMELYWADNEDKDGNGILDKQERIVDSLMEGEYLFISSNRQYGTISRVPARYPLTARFYRELFACPPPEPVSRCADRAQPGEIQNDFGYELVKVFESNPRLFGIEISDQAAEESFTVYDHPQVLIFKKAADFDPERLRVALSSVDVSRVQNVPLAELEAGGAPSAMISAGRWQGLRSGGTWAQLFPPDGLLNRAQPLAVVAWWLMIAVLGWAAFPLTRRALPGLEDGGYALARIMGLLLFAWVSWMLGSVGVPVTRITLALVVIAFLIVGAAVAWRDREPLLALVSEKRSEILFVEGLALSFFALDLVIRLGNPDLWHPSKGGEKPMDLSYLHAVLKSRTYPPYDPWFAGGYINYYYFGFVLIGLPMKLLGIDPTIAYNLAIPTLFALLASATYAVGYHLSDGVRGGAGVWVKRLGGLAAALMLVLLGNLGTARMMFEALQSVAGSGAAGAQNIFVDTFQALKGIPAVLSGARLPIGLDSWYWDPSRAIPPGPGEPGPITEFPFFTFLYADLHAHMIALPLTVAVLAWSLSWLRAAARRGPISTVGGVWALAVGGLLVGSLRATNTWDFPVYLILGGLAVVGAAWLRERQISSRAVVEAVISAGLLVGLAFLLFLPFSRWYAQGYTEAALWQGSKTPILAYLTVYGLFLFVLVSWFIWETRQWMAATPISALARLRAYIPIIFVVALAVVIGTASAFSMGYRTALIVVPLVVWAGILILRPDQTVGKRVGLFLAATAAALTLVVEVVVLRGDIGRMNTVFKFYLQVWTLLSVVSGAAVAWIIHDFNLWSSAWRGVWRVGLAGLVFAAALYPLTAAPAKIKDRMAAEAPNTLDGMAFMRYAERSELGQRFELAEDYEAIHWLQANVEGSPIIVEANIPEYRWGTRYTIYTGLPNVLGWNWHQRQQRVSSGAEQVTERVHAITDFYTNPSAEHARGFLQEYHVSYVIAGRLERIYYAEVEPCWPQGDANQSVTCDMGGRAVGMTAPDVSPEVCTPITEAENPPTLRCPTQGFEKFERLIEQGILEVAFEFGRTRIYKVIR